MTKQEFTEKLLIEYRKEEKKCRREIVHDPLHFSDYAAGEYLHYLAGEMTKVDPLAFNFLNLL